MSLLSPLELLRRVPLLSVLSRAQLAAVADATVKCSLRRGGAIVTRGQTSNALFILLSGRARVTITSDNRREVILSVLTVGDYVGEMSLIDNQPHSADVYCDTACDVLILEGAAFAGCLRDNPDLSQALLQGLVARLRGAIRQIESLALLDVYGRVARALLDMAEDVHGRRLIRDKVSRLRLAKSVGASRELVSRVLVDLERRGAIHTQPDGSVLLKRPSDLSEAAVPRSHRRLEAQAATGVETAAGE